MSNRLCKTNAKHGVVSFCDFYKFGDNFRVREYVENVISNKVTVVDDSTMTEEQAVMHYDCLVLAGWEEALV